MTGYSWVQGLTPSRVAGFTSAFLVVAIAGTLAQATWLLWPGNDGRVGEPSAVAAPRASGKQPVARLGPVADLSLFGSAPTATESALDAPETQLNLTLRGVWANSSRLLARAIVAAGGGSEEAYRIGDPLPGGAVLEEVLPDRVILKRGARLEALYLPKESTAGFSEFGMNSDTQEPNGSPAGPAVEMSGNLGAKLQDYRQRILNDPQQIFGLARMQPVMEDGKLKGYKLSPNKEKQLFREVGLRPGDVVTSVNGLPLSDPAAAGQVMAQVSSATQLTLTVDRGGREETIVVPVGN